jgi:hypothetical protein
MSITNDNVNEARELVTRCIKTMEGNKINYDDVNTLCNIVNNMCRHIELMQQQLQVELTNDESVIVDMLNDSLKLFLNTPRLYGDKDEFINAIHNARNIIFARLYRRMQV